MQSIKEKQPSSTSPPPPPPPQHLLHAKIIHIWSNQQRAQLTDEVHVVPPCSTQSVPPTPSLGMSVLPVRLTRVRSREALPAVLHSEGVVTTPGCQRCTEIDPLGCTSIMKVFATVRDGSAGLVDEASNRTIRWH